MTLFEIQKELGQSSILHLREKNYPPTPWLLSTAEGLRLDDQILHMANLTEHGYTILATDIMVDLVEYDHIPEFTIFTPLLYPAYEYLEKSHHYELNLFLDRLDKLRDEGALPEIYGFVYAPLSDPKWFLDEILGLNPSIIAIRIRDIETMPTTMLIETIMDIREKIPRNIALYLPGGSMIGLQTFLIALGIDIVDDAGAYRMAANQYLMKDGFLHRLSRDEMDLSILVKENLDAINNDFDGIKFALERNQLWTRLAREMHVSPKIAGMIKQFKMNYLGKSQSQLSQFPTKANNKLYFTGDEGLYHPDILSFQQKVMERYLVSSDIRLLVLLPCSASKPYSNSKSHRKFSQAIGKGARKINRFTEVWTLTSPLGVVPRPIETIYPAAYYDIPVTGDWSAEEIIRTGNMLKEMIEKVPLEVKILVHISYDYRGMINHMLDQVDANNRSRIKVSWMDHKPTSNEALQQLEKTVADLAEKIKEEGDLPAFEKMRKYERMVHDQAPGLLRYMHGAGVEVNLDSIRVVGFPPRPIQIQKNGKHYFTWDTINASIRLSPDLAAEIAHESANWILLDTNRLRGSTLYTIGVFNASEHISPGDEVLIFNRDKTRLIGLGEAIISGQTMNRIDNGIAATIRKRCEKEV